MEAVKDLAMLFEASAIVVFWTGLVALVVVEGAITLLDALNAR